MVGMEANACLSCRFSSIKVDVSVPEKYDLKKFAKETKRFSTNITGATKNKPIHYNVTFQPQNSGIDFNVNCTCILNVKKHDCSNFNHAQNLRIKHLNHSKLPHLEVTQRIWRF